MTPPKKPSTRRKGLTLGDVMERNRTLPNLMLLTYRMSFDGKLLEMTVRDIEKWCADVRGFIADYKSGRLTED